MFNSQKYILTYIVFRMALIIFINKITQGGYNKKKTEALSLLYMTTFYQIKLFHVEDT